MSPALHAGKTEHHALVAGALLFAVFLLLGVDPHGDVRRLAMQQDLDIGAVVRKAILVVADVLDDAARGFGDDLAIDHGFVAVLLKQRRLPATLPRNDDLVRRAQGLAAEPGIHLAFVGDAEPDVVLEESVENRVGNLIADLVRVPFGNRLAGEQIV